MMRIGLVYDRFGDMPAPAGAPPDWDAEFEPEETVAALEAVIRRLGHEPVRVGNARSLLDAIAGGGPAVDAAINIAEGYGGRNREAYAPVLLEIAGIPFVGSDALTLSVTLDKHLSKLVMSTTTVATPAWRVVERQGDVEWREGEWPDGEWRDGEWPQGKRPEPALPAPSGAEGIGSKSGQRSAADASDHDPSPSPPSPQRPLAASHLPVFVKPRYEGTAKGIAKSSRCDTVAALRAEVARQRALYEQDLVVEAFVEGAEYTVAVVGDPPATLPALQRATDRTTGIGVHALTPADGLDYELAGSLTPELERRLHEAAVLAHEAFECRDFSRSDFRVDRDGVIWFLEINPLPTFAPDGTFAIAAELAGRPYDEFLADVIGAALGRVRTRASW